MPNTLAHFGAQGVVTRLLVPGADPKWIFAGCILPDVPWMIRRGVLAITPGVDPIDLRLYGIGQSTLAVSLVLAGALALTARRPRRVFLILSLSVLLHLLLDACQTKWGNGVHLFAPLSWSLWNFDLFWPEDWPTYALSVFGLAWFGFVWWRRDGVPIGLAPKPRRLLVAAALLAVYLLLPWLLIPGAEATDQHFATTIRDPGAGAPVELDRALYRRDEGGASVATWARRDFETEGLGLDHSAPVSLRGRFVDPATIEITELHEHRGPSRDIPTYVGLALLLLVWLRRSPGRRD